MWSGGNWCGVVGSMLRQGCGGFPGHIYSIRDTYYPSVPHTLNTHPQQKHLPKSHMLLNDCQISGGGCVDAIGVLTINHHVGSWTSCMGLGARCARYLRCYRCGQVHAMVGVFSQCAACAILQARSMMSQPRPHLSHGRPCWHHVGHNQTIHTQSDMKTPNMPGFLITLSRSSGTGLLAVMPVTSELVMLLLPWGAMMVFVCVRNVAFFVVTSSFFTLGHPPTCVFIIITMQHQQHPVLNNTQASALVHGLLQEPSLHKQCTLIEQHYTRNALFTHPLFLVQGVRCVAGVYTAWRLANKQLRILHIDTGMGVFVVVDLITCVFNRMYKPPCQPWTSATPQYKCSTSCTKSHPGFYYSSPRFSMFVCFCILSAPGTLSLERVPSTRIGPWTILQPPQRPQTTPRHHVSCGRRMQSYSIRDPSPISCGCLPLRMYVSSSPTGCGGSCMGGGAWCPS